MSLALVGFVVTALGHFTLAMYLTRAGYLARGAGRPQSLAVLAVLATAAWGLSGVADQLSRFTGPSYVVAGVDLLRYGLWMAVLLALLKPKTTNDVPPDSRSGPNLVGPAAALLVLAVGALAWRLATKQYESDASRLWSAVFLALPVFGLVLVEQLFRNLPADSRWAAKPVCMGLAALFAFDVYVFAEAVLLGRVDPDARDIRPMVHLVAVPFLWIAARRRTDWSRSLQVSRRAAFYSATLLLAGGYLLFISAVGYYVRYFGGDWGRALQLGLGFAGLVSLLIFGLSASIRARVRVFVGKHFFSYRFDYREEWLAFTDMLASDTGPQEVGERVIRALANVVECPAGSLWTRRSDGDVFAQVARWNAPQVDDTEPAPSPFCAFLARDGWIIDLDEYRHSPRDYGELALPLWLLGNAQAWAVIPLLAQGDLLGYVVLQRPRTPVELNWEVRDLLKTASRQAAGYLAQMRATEALLESRKFDAFNRMSAFVVHDLKNIVTQLSLMMKNAQKHRDNPEFQQDMLETVESSLEKMRRLMLQLREGATPPGTAHGVALPGIVARLQRSAAAAGRTVDVDVQDDVSTRGHEDRLERVLGHLVQNALDATPLEGRVWMRVARHSGQVEVQVGDTGKGMTEEFVQNQLFRPFASTKRTGMGIGSYESAQYIRELGGSLEVRSQPGQGTLITIRLPLFDTRTQSDLSLSGRS